ncbi:MAG: GC-type dockerin domain-anchored protein, partial [Planctomycetota bacterium]
IEDVPQTQPILPPQPPQTPVFRFPPVLTFFGFPIPFDPVVTIGYDFHVLSGPAFATFAPPDLAFGDDTYEVIADGTSTTIVFGERHEFPPGGVSSFQVRGIEVEAGIDPLDAEAFVAELGFVATGVVEIVMIPITEEVGGCNGADLAEPFGILSQADVAAFVDAFFANDPRVAQLASPFDVVSQADVNEFVSLFFEGCPVQ